MGKIISALEAAEDVLRIELKFGSTQGSTLTAMQFVQQAILEQRTQQANYELVRKEQKDDRIPRDAETNKPIMQSSRKL